MKVEGRKRDVAVDFVKFIATILVLNSHMSVCYGKYSALATGGGIGDALFFFISGFTLFMGRKMDFVDWYKRRISRIYPTILAVGIVACLIFNKDYTFMEVMFAGKYWFLQCILVSYLLLFPLIRYDWNLKVCIPLSLGAVIAFYPLFDFNGAMFYGVDNYYRWIFFFAVMLIGGGIYKLKDNVTYKWWCIPLAVICVVAWYGINYVTKGSGWIILSMIPLVGICYLTYAIGKHPWIEKLYEFRISGNVLYIVGSLCLESYMIQKYIFTDALNFLFPLNIPIIMIMVLVSAYLLHILSGTIEQIFDSKPFNWKTLLLYKN